MPFKGTDGYWDAVGEEFSAGRWTGVEAFAPGYAPVVAELEIPVGGMIFAAHIGVGVNQLKPFEKIFLLNDLDFNAVGV